MMRRYALEQTAILVQRLAGRLKKAGKKADADAIHDVRVAVRRLSRCLRLFAPFYPDHSWKKMRRRLSKLMAAAGAVRDCDIALELLEQAKMSVRTAVVVSLKSERKKKQTELDQEIRRWEKKAFLHNWKSRLEL